MEDTNKKIDELTELVKGNAVAIDELAAIVKSGFDHVGEEIVAVRSDLSTKIDSVRTELKNEISSVRTELKNEISSVRNELKNEISSEISSVRTEISSLRSEMHDGFARIDKNFLIADNKVDKLTAKLEDKGVITQSDAKEVMTINPLPLF